MYLANPSPCWSGVPCWAAPPGWENSPVIGSDAPILIGSLELEPPLPPPESPPPQAATLSARNPVADTAVSRRMIVLRAMLPPATAAIDCGSTGQSCERSHSLSSIVAVPRYGPGRTRRVDPQVGSRLPH